MNMVDTVLPMSVVFRFDGSSKQGNWQFLRALSSPTIARPADPKSPLHPRTTLLRSSHRTSGRDALSGDLTNSVPQRSPVEDMSDGDPSQAWRILRQLGWSCRRPVGRALERDESKIRHWNKQRWPEIKKTSKRRPHHRLRRRKRIERAPAPLPHLGAEGTEAGAAVPF
jgi:hypothetical protein